MQRTVFHRSSISLTVLGIAIIGTFVVVSTLLAAAQLEKQSAANIPSLPTPPKLSSFAPAKDLEKQVQEYIKELETTLESEQEYKDTEGKVGRCASTLAAIALCLGMHDENTNYKTIAPALIKTSQQLAATTDYQSAKKAFESVKEAVDGKSQAKADLKWEKVAPLPELMKQVPNINTKLKRNIKGTKFKTKAKDTTGLTAAIAAIAQGSMADTSKAKTSDEVVQWYKYSIHMRDAAGAVNAAISTGNKPAADEAMQTLTKSCDDCHTVFHPEAKLKEEAEESE
jgi:hypothetical protein